MIKANAHKYSVSAMCRVLQVNRSTYYYEAATKKDESELTADIQEIFRKSRNHYGTRKIKKELADCGKQVSRRRIGRIMKQEGLVSSYTTAQFKPQKDRCNESKVENVLNRQFQNQPYRNVVVSDLTYVRVGNRWNYICVLIDRKYVIICTLPLKKHAAHQGGTFYFFFLVRNPSGNSFDHGKSRFRSSGFGKGPILRSSSNT